MSGSRFHFQRQTNSRTIDSSARCRGYHCIRIRPGAVGRFQGTEVSTAMNRCRSCGGNLEDGRVTHAEEFSGQIAILENVPARVCKQCGDGLFRPEVVEKIQQLIWSAVTPNRMSQVPVYDLSETPPVEESQLDLAWSSEFPFSTQSIDSNAQNAPGVYEILQ